MRAALHGHRTQKRQRGGEEVTAPAAFRPRQKKKRRATDRGEEEERGQRHVSEYGAYSSTNKPAHHRWRAVVGATQLRECFNAHAHTHTLKDSVPCLRAHGPVGRGVPSLV